MMQTRTVANQIELAQVIAESGGGPHYVYLLCEPNEDGTASTPFYVGIGQGSRLFSHENDARDERLDSPKLRAIRGIWSQGKAVVRLIDSVHSVDPWDREEELINQIGLLSEGKGPLTNSQSYARSHKVEGVELRKYVSDLTITGDIEAMPPRFKLTNTRLKAGPIEPKSRSSVFGKIYAIAEANPGVTGEQLIRLLQGVDFSGNKSAYTQSGRVSVSWLAGYLEGAYYRSDRLHIQNF